MTAPLADYEGAIKHIVWMAQTVHQAYHQDIPGNWMSCPRDICGSTRYFLSLESGPEEKEPNHER